MRPRRLNPPPAPPDNPPLSILTKLRPARLTVNKCQPAGFFNRKFTCRISGYVKNLEISEHRANRSYSVLTVSTDPNSRYKEDRCAGVCSQKYRPYTYLQHIDLNGHSVQANEVDAYRAAEEKIDMCCDYPESVDAVVKAATLVD